MSNIQTKTAVIKLAHAEGYRGEEPVEGLW